MASLYYYKVKDLISQVEDPSDGLLTFSNLSDVEAKGIEFELGMHVPQIYFRAHASFSVQDTNNNETQNDLPNSPTYLGKFNILAPIYSDKIFVGPEVQYIGKRRTVNGGQTDSSLVTNLTISTSKNLIPYLPTLELSMSCYNLFGEHYADPVTADFRQEDIVQDGRTFLLKATYAF